MQWYSSIFCLRQKIEQWIQVLGRVQVKRLHRSAETPCGSGANANSEAFADEEHDDVAAGVWVAGSEDDWPSKWRLSAKLPSDVLKEKPLEEGEEEEDQTET
ncbi:hypothetical protein AXG93_4510s1320 [Marchantia polymorpha subsp. ruderalis]|uniref:Uncharacterized protein n=1 Tax=Marchantia polymorpha subsp. ruderalis TaxID=1480154 RepID=A0A176WGT1_MARPO|nr:hypothetical protein AXG93_4510s1320 [Marchantia polymorpha subsp. ruderalis]